MVSDLAELDGYPYCGHSALLGIRKRAWRETQYILAFFGRRLPEARRAYRGFVEKVIVMGRRPELAGGRLIRSLGGWDEVRKMRLSGHDRIKADQRILGDGDFVWEVLRKVAALFHLEPDYIVAKGRQADRVGARDLLCYGCAVELGLSMAELARRLGLTLAAVSYSVNRGEKTARETGWHLAK